MKLLFTILASALLIASCSPVPQAVIVETAPLNESVEAVSDSSKRVSEEIVKVEESADRASDKTRDLLAQMKLVRALSGANVELQEALDEQERLGREVQDELDKTKQAVKSLAAAKDVSDANVIRLQVNADQLTKDVSKANERAVEMEEQTAKAIERYKDSEAKSQPIKDKLAWWRWRYLPISIFVIFAQLVWIFRKPIMRLSGIPIP